MDSDIQKFNQNYIENLGNNLEFYLHYLSTMAKFHKYSAEDLAGLSVYAPQNFSAVASPDVWKKHFHRSISKNARGVDIFRDGKKITVYDVSETDPPDKISSGKLSKIVIVADRNGGFNINYSVKNQLIL